MSRILLPASLLILAGAVAPGRPSARLVESTMADGRFTPMILTVHPGDTLRFRNGAGGPHNIQFFADSITAPARALLDGAMPEEKISPLSSHLLLEEEESYQFIVPALPPGRYPFVCLPHFAIGMKGAMVVEAAP